MISPCGKSMLLLLFRLRITTFFSVQIVACTNKCLRLYRCHFLSSPNHCHTHGIPEQLVGPSILYQSLLSFVKPIVWNKSVYPSTIWHQMVYLSIWYRLLSNLWRKQLKMLHPYKIDLQIFFWCTEQLPKLQQMSHHVSCKWIELYEHVVSVDNNQKWFVWKRASKVKMAWTHGVHGQIQGCNGANSGTFCISWHSIQDFIKSFIRISLNLLLSCLCLATISNHEHLHHSYIPFM